jgi:carboxylesterase
MNPHNSQKYNFFLKGGKKAILLVHGITGTPSEMNYLGKTLNKAGYTVVCNALPRHCDTLDELKKVTWQEIVDAVSRDFWQLKKEHHQVYLGGISMGALVAVHLAQMYPADVAGLIALSPTFFYDGWAIHKGKVLLPLVWHIPYLRRLIDIRESWPYGLKDETLRTNIERFYVNAKARASRFNNKVLLFGSPFFPVACLYQHHIFSKVVRKELPFVKNPILIIHAKEDDMTSLKNAEFLLENISSAHKLLVVLENSYHMITIDKEKDKVASEIVKFLK